MLNRYFSHEEPPQTADCSAAAIITPQPGPEEEDDLQERLSSQSARLINFLTMKEFLNTLPHLGEAPQRELLRLLEE